VVPPQPILASFNFFMNIAVLPDGNDLETRATVSRPGDWVILRAEMDCFVAFSACPQDVVPIHGVGGGTPRDAAFTILDSGFPNLPPRGSWVPGCG
jgi:hypothetical protein